MTALQRSSSRFDLAGVSVVVVDVAGSAVLGMTVVRVDGVGEHSMPAQPGCSLRLTRRG
jgi:hypothetical protein